MFQNQEKQKDWGFKLTNGAIGIGITIYKLCKSCIKDNNEIIIVEDDAVLDNDFINRFIDIKKQLKGIDYDMVYLGHSAYDSKKIRTKNRKYL